MVEKLRAQTNEEAYLLAVVNGLEALAKSNNNLRTVLESSERKLSECWEYICSKAKKEAKNGSACVEDNVVYGWAAEFFQMSAEDYEKLNKPSKQAPIEKQKVKTQEVQKVEEQEESLEEELEEEEQPKKSQHKVKTNITVVPGKKEPKERESSIDLKGQMSLFDFSGGWNEKR